MSRKSYIEKLFDEFPDLEEEIVDFWETEGNRGDWDNSGIWVKYSQKTMYENAKEKLMEIKNEK